MIKKIFTILFVCFSAIAKAQGADSLFVNDSRPAAIMYRSRSGEDVFTISRRFHVPPAVLADANKLGYKDAPAAGTHLLIPLGAYNLLSRRPVNENETRPLYYKVTDGESLGRISRSVGVSKNDLESWNGVRNRDLEKGKVLLVGWVMYDPTKLSAVKPEKVATTGAKTEKQEVKTPVVTPVEKDTNKQDVPVEVAKVPEGPEAIYLQQTNNGQNVTAEKGTVAFFPGQSRQNKEPFFAFFDKAPKGTIIKISNQGNDKSVYVKVLGPLPKTKLYYNAVIGVSAYAKEMLGVKDNRAWCELSYAKQ